MKRTKRLIVLAIFLSVIVVILLAAIQVYNPAETPEGAVVYTGTSPIEKLRSLADSLNSQNVEGEDAVYVAFSGYSAAEKSWTFSISVGINQQDMLRRQSGEAVPVINHYSDVLESVFVEASHILPENKDTLVVYSVLGEMGIVIDSTDTIPSIHIDPGNWRQYLLASESGQIMTDSDLQAAIQGAIASGG